MKKLLSILFLFAVCASAQGQILQNYGGERAGLSTLSFLKNDMSVRSMGMGGASLALDGDAYAIISNPASLTHLENQSYALSHLFIGAGINQSYLSGIYPLKDKQSVLSFSLNSLNSGAMEERTEFQPEGTGRVFYVSNIATGLTYSRQLSKMFSAGISIKYIYEGIAEYSNHTATVDMAFLYETDFKDLQFAVMIQNFGGNSALRGTDETELPVVFNRSQGIGLDANTVPTIFKLGASFIPWKTDNQHLLVSAQLNHPNDNSENYRMGMEYDFKEIFTVRAGYKLSVVHQDFPTFGFSYRTRLGSHPLYIDYAANPTNYLGVQNLIGLRFSLINDQR